MGKEILKLSLLQMAAAASNKTTSRKEIKYPEIEEEALQFVLDSCESSISKYSKFLQVVNYSLVLLFYNHTKHGYRHGLLPLSHHVVLQKEVRAFKGIR